MTRKQKEWQFKVSFALVGLVGLLILGFFYQSYVEVRAQKPVAVAIERIQAANEGETDQE